MLYFLFMATIAKTSNHEQTRYKYQRVNIYAIHTETDFAFDDIDDNYIRVNHKFFFSCSDFSYVQKVSDFFLSKLDSLPKYAYASTRSNIRLVIDFIDRDEIASTVLMNQAQTFYISQSTSKYGYFELKREEICQLKSLIPFLHLVVLGGC